MSLYVQKKQVAGEVSLTPGAVISEWLVSLMDFGCKGIPGRCRRCPVSINLYAKEGKKEPFFLSAQAWRFSMYEGAHSSFIPPTTATVAVTTSTQLSPIDHRPVILL